MRTWWSAQIVALVAIMVSMAACGSSPTASTPTAAPHKPPNPIHYSPVPVATGTPAASSADGYLTAWPLPPLCPQSATGAAVCQAPFGGGDRQAPAGESILFRFGWTAATKPDCEAFASDTTVRATVDGHAVGLVNVPCQLFATSPFPSGYGPANTWSRDARYLRSPFPPGQHTASVTITYNAALSDGISQTIASGTVQTFQMTLTVG